MTPEQAEAMLKELSAHFKCPVQPVSRYCAALKMWASAVNRAAEEPDEGKSRSMKPLADSINYTFRSIEKSCLLDRLIYGGEELRTEKCPEHKGHWSGLEWGENKCPHGCGLTGWLPK